MNKLPENVRIALMSVGLFVGSQHRETLEAYIKQLQDELAKEKRLNASPRQASTQRIPKDI
jgi:hypothetical protein